MPRPPLPDKETLATLLPLALERPAIEGARVVALSWLHRLHAARTQWGAALSPSHAGNHSADTAQQVAEALHDARVALRRLRATLREHRALLEPGVGRRATRALQQIGRATGETRDSDVQRAWLDAEMEGLPTPVRLEAEAMRQALTVRVQEQARRVNEAFERHFDPHFPRMARRLSAYSVNGHVGEPFPNERFAMFVALRLKRSVTRVQRSLLKINGVENQDALHATRISLKRLRALLSPFVSARPALGALYEAATRGQDSLGAMRDAHVFSLKAGKAGATALAGVLEDVCLGHYASFANEWVADGGARALAGGPSALAALRYTVGTPEHANNGNASGDFEHGDLPLEIERKYLLRGIPPEAMAVPGVGVEQGWLPGTELRERLRCATYPTGDVHFTRTVKLGRGISRVEVEEETDAALFDALWPLTAKARVSKRRHVVREGDFAWEIDIFAGRDLVLAEVELENESDTPALPSWLAPWVVREVTGEVAYLNSSLALPSAE